MRVPSIPVLPVLDMAVGFELIHWEGAMKVAGLRLG